ncbi:hypothetical protein ABIE52_001334 [Rhodococcus sp. OAS809]|uniref:hypothetical protein n=1 Tax=Rhodococcus sp. OAS809 TaxID=2663874 RepID=UPI00178A277F
MSESKQVSVTTANFGGAATVSATVSIWQPFAVQHLWTALHMANLCNARENDLHRLGKLAPDIEHQSLATTAAMSAVYFVEAYINDIYAIAADDNRTLRTQLDGIDSRAVDLLGLVWKGTDVAAVNWTILDKYQFALAVAGKPRMNTGANPYQNMKRLIKLRNTLAHFKSEWQRNDVPHEVEKSLKNLFPDSRLYTGAPWFPQVCLASGCAKWACDTSTAFVDAWRSEMGVQFDYKTTMTSMPQP